MYKKGLITEGWGKHLLFLLQDSGMDYLRRSMTSDMSGLRINDSKLVTYDTYLIHFVLFSMQWVGNAWVPKITTLYDTTIRDVENMLGAEQDDRDIGLEKFTRLLHDRIGSVPVIK